ncbi:CPBP family intramembrane glutamic endopeptidase [Cytobacillus dafuensis]|nr:type II CAAX endopeptidase family protein [Cytobacillus dafuensis]
MKKAWLVSFIRLPLLFISLMVLYILFHFIGGEFDFYLLPILSTLSFTIVNIGCFIFLHLLLKKEGLSLKKLIGFRSDFLIKDILFGFLWLFVLYIPFVLAVIGTMFLLYGTDLFQHFQTVFVADEESISLSVPRWFIWTTASISAVFPFLNAPIEELMYRGYSQPMFINEYKKVWIGIVIPSIGFALQHIILATTLQGTIVYAVAFFLWGIGSGIIYHKQKRLFPLIVCHFIVNITFGIIPIVFLVLGT